MQSYSASILESRRHVPSTDDGDTTANEASVLETELITCSYARTLHRARAHTTSWRVRRIVEDIICRFCFVRAADTHVLMKELPVSETRHFPTSIRFDVP